MLFWTNIFHERPLTSTPPPLHRTVLRATTEAEGYCYLEEVLVVINDYALAPDSIQPANLTRYTECLTRPELPGLGPDGHRGIAISRDGPEGVWPTAPVAVAAAEGRIFLQVLTRALITPAAIEAVLRDDPTIPLPIQLPNFRRRLATIPVPKLWVAIHLEKVL